LAAGANFRLGQGQDDAYHVQTKLESTLTVLAHHKPLHTLRMLNYPDIRYISAPAPNNFDSSSITNEEALLCQTAMQHFSYQVMQFMAKAGSSLRVFSADPSMPPKKDCGSPNKDTNGHQWPQYVYRRSRAVDAWGREHVVAAPLANYPAEIPGSIVLSHNQ
jgi:hypothetical protein